MKAVDIPDKFPIPFAADAGGAYIRPIPEASQIGIDNGAASLTDGFPPLNFVPRSAGGVPPFGEDMNGILNQITAWSQWQNAGATVEYDSDFAADIAGYPAGATLSSSVYESLLWRSIADDNLTDPDAASASGWVRQTRMTLTANTTFYVATTGNDSNSGLLVGSPWLTLSHAAAFIQNSVDFNGKTVTIQIADGTYNGTQVLFYGNCPGQVTPIQIRGNLVDTEHDAVILNLTTNNTVLTASAGASLNVQGVKLTSSGGLNACGAVALLGGTIRLDNVNYGACTQAHMLADVGGYIGSGNAYVTGGAGYHALARNGGATIVLQNATETLVGTPAFTIYVGAYLTGVINCPAYAFTGSATGKRYEGQGNTVMSGTGVDVNYFPGNSAGTSTNGAEYY